MANILIIEDEPMLRQLMKNELESRGHTVVEAENGQLGWDQLELAAPTMVLLDLLMPVMSGYDFLKKLRADDAHKEIPCIVLSNSGQVNDLQRAYECGADDVLIKAEFNPDQLVTKVEDRLKNAPKHLQVQAPGSNGEELRPNR